MFCKTSFKRVILKIFAKNYQTKKNKLNFNFFPEKKMLFALTCFLLLLTSVLTLPVSSQPYSLNMTMSHSKDLRTYEVDMLVEYTANYSHDDDDYFYLDDDDTYSYDVGEFLGDAHNLRNFYLDDV